MGGQESERTTEKERKEGHWGGELQWNKEGSVDRLKGDECKDVGGVL